MTRIIIWVCSGLVALGAVLVVAAALALSGRVRPLRRALRRLSWRREELDRLRTRAEGLQDQIAALHERAEELADSRARATAAATRSGR